MPITLAGAALAAQGLLGAGQMVAGLLTTKPEIPEAEIPSEIYQNMTDAEYWSYIGMPEEQRQRYIETIQSSTAGALASSRDRKGGLGMVSNIARSEKDAYRDVASMDVQARMNNMDKLTRAREVYGQTAMQVDDKNRDIAMFKYGERNKMMGAGLQNMMGATGTAGSLSSMFGGDTLWNKKTTATATQPNNSPYTNTGYIPSQNNQTTFVSRN